MNSHESTPDKTLALAFKMMNEWESLMNFDLVLSEHRRIDNSQITDMAAALCRNTFRKRTVIDSYIDQFSKKRPRGRIYKVLRLAVCQLLEEDLQKEIVCDTAVRFCRSKWNKFEASFVNQFLRQMTATPLPLPSSDKALALSPQLLRQWRKHFDEEQIKTLAELLQKPAGMTARLAMSKPAIEDLKHCLNEIDLPEWSQPFKFFRVARPGEFIEKNNNRLYIQDPATTSSISLLKPQDGEVIADLCAAPGGKSRMIAELLSGTGCVLSCDVSSKRLKSVKENLYGLSNVKIMQNDALDSCIDEASCDAVLLDVPCSNSGVIRRKPDVRWTFSMKKLDELRQLQLKILTASAKLVKPGGRIVYSTCSIDPEENEKIVESFLEHYPQAELKESRTILPCELHDGSHASLIYIK